jgi:hypothetical protein
MPERPPFPPPPPFDDLIPTPPAPPSEAEIAAFVEGWRTAAADYRTFYQEGDWIVLRKVRPLQFSNGPKKDLLGAPMHNFDAVIEAFKHFTGHDRDNKDHLAAETVFLFAVQTMLYGDESYWTKIRTLAGQVSNESRRRGAALAIVTRMLALFHRRADTEGLAKAEDAMTAWEILCQIDDAFACVDLVKVVQWFGDATSDNVKGGRGHKGPAWLTAMLAVSAGALGFPRAGKNAPASDVASATRALLKVAPGKAKARRKPSL